jgi:hypothetical protein
MGVLFWTYTGPGSRTPATREPAIQFSPLPGAKRDGPENLAVCVMTVSVTPLFRCIQSWRLIIGDFFPALGYPTKS